MTMNVPVAVTIYKSQFEHVGACSRAVLYAPCGLTWGLRALLRVQGCRHVGIKFLVLDDQWAEVGDARVTLDCWGMEHGERWQSHVALCRAISSTWPHLVLTKVLTVLYIQLVLDHIVIKSPSLLSSSSFSGFPFFVFSVVPLCYHISLPLNPPPTPWNCSP